VDICAQIDISNFDANDEDVEWSISNDTGGSISIDAFYFDWPGSNDELIRVRLSGSEIWDGGDESPPTNITSGLGGNRIIASGQSKTIEFRFDEDAASSGYDLEIAFDIGCSPQHSQ
jgi:hypothetical protein